jgi:hypothetical protein
MEKDFTAIERAAPPKRMVYSDFAWDDFRLRSQELPLADQFNGSSAAVAPIYDPGRAQAAALFARFNEVFWDEELGFYAYALDGDKNKVLTIASNAGHCLWSGIVPRERAKRVVDRLMAPDMWTGSGIRTLPAYHPAFNPYNYQTGSVWPHDNAIIAKGFKLCGFAAEAHDVSVAASHFLLNQLPELYTASERNESNSPVQYIGANVPQAWAAGSAFMLTHALLGFLPDGPTWVPDLTVRDLRIGKHKLDIRFWREEEQTAFEVIKGDPKLVERCDHALYRDLTTARAGGTVSRTFNRVAAERV